MCNVDCIKWGARNLSDAEVRGKRVLEVGSYEVNGSLRYVIELLRPAEYVGVDIEKGPGVDMVCRAEELTRRFGKESFDMVVSTCALEHIRPWKEAVSNIKNVCRSDGIMLIIVPSEWPFHQHPSDFWRYSREDVSRIFSDCDIISIEEIRCPPVVPQLRTKKSAVFAKIHKPREFVENDLSKCSLHSIVTNTRVTEIHEADFQCLHFRWLTLRNHVMNALLRIAGYIL